MYQTTLTELILLTSGAIVIAVASYIYGLSAGIEKERKNMNEEYLPCEYCGGSGIVKGLHFHDREYIEANCTKCKGKGYFKNEHNDPIKPSHYHTGNIDVIKFSEENFSVEELKGFYRMNILKYTTRYDKKNGLEDLEKATFYLDKLKELERGKYERD